MGNPALAARNRDAFSEAGLSDANMVSALGISPSYADQLLAGSKPISAPIRGKLAALIAAKANGPAESPYVLEHGEIRERADFPAEIIDQADDAVEPAGSYLNRLVIGTGYRVEGVPGGGYRITQTVAECVDQSFARAICDLLNGEKG